MPRLKKKVETTPVSVPRTRELPETLTAGRSRRTIKPNPRYMNDEMLVPSTKAVDENEVSEDEYIVDFEENDDPEDSGMVIRKAIRSSTPQTTDGQPKRRGRPPKLKPLDAPRTEPIKNLRKEVLKKMDYKTISISKTRHMGSAQLMPDGRRKLNLTIDSVESDSADHEELEDDMDAQSMRSQDSVQTNRNASKIIDRHGNVVKRGPIDSKMVRGDTTEDDEFEEVDDDDDYMHGATVLTSDPENAPPAKRPVGRPRKHPVKPVYPYAGKVLLPGMKTSPLSMQPAQKRKALEMDDAVSEKQAESQQSKMLRRSYGLKSVNSQNQSREVDSDEPDEKHSPQQQQQQQLQQQQNRSATLPALQRPGVGRPAKGPMAALGGNRLFAKVNNSPTITIVNVNDIMKMKSKGATDIRPKLMRMPVEDEDDRDSEEVYEMEELQSGRKQDGGQKTNNQLVASILERKRSVPLETLQDVRRQRMRETVPKRSNQRPEQQQQQQSAADEIVDFEDMLQKNIVSMSETRMVTVGGAAARGRGVSSAGSQHQDENYAGGLAAKSARYTPNNRLPKSVAGAKRLQQPPRILNATMKLGDRHPNTKQSVVSGNNHYSIDLTDPDNNVKLVSSSTETSPVKRSPISASQYAKKLPALGSTKPGVGRMTAGTAPPPEVRKRRVTCYETWNVIHIKSIDSTLKPPSFALSMMGLANVAEAVSLPSGEWSLRTVLERRKGPPPKDGELYRGSIMDNEIKEEEKTDYEPSRIMFRRKAPSPGRFNVQFDRTVSFRNDTYSLNVDGQSCRLMGAPNRLETMEDIEMLLQIVDYVDLKNGCVAINAPPVRRVATSKEAVIL